MADTNSDSDTTAPITEMTYEQWKESLIFYPNYQGEFYMPQHVRVLFEQE